MRSVIFSSFIAVGIVAAQVNTASLTGLVKDSSEAAIVKAKITAIHKATGVERTTETDNGGSYFLPILPVGDYELSAEASGFRINAAQRVNRLSQKEANRA